MKHFKLGIILIGLTLCFSNTSFAQTGSTEQDFPIINLTYV